MTLMLKVAILLVLLKLFLWDAVAQAGTLVIGRVSNNPNKNYQELKPLLDYVVNQLNDQGITEGSVLLVKNKEEMIRLLKEGKVDWATKGVFQALLYERAAGAEMLLRSWRQGTPSYHSLIFTRAESSIKSIKDLKDKKIAFQDRGSTSAYFVPSAMLMKEGLELVELASPRDKVPAGKVGYVFAREELNISAWVHRGLTDAGAYHNQDWAKPENNPEAMKKDLRIVHRSKELPRMIEVVRRDLDPKIKSRLKEILLKAHEDPKAREALKRYSETTRFAELEGEAQEGLEEARRMMKFIGHEIN